MGGEPVSVVTELSPGDPLERVDDSASGAPRVDLGGGAARSSGSTAARSLDPIAFRVVLPKSFVVAPGDALEDHVGGSAQQHVASNRGVELPLVGDAARDEEDAVLVLVQDSSIRSSCQSRSADASIEPP